MPITATVSTSPDACRAEVDPRMTLHFVLGAAGAGKTQLLRRIMGQATTAPRYAFVTADPAFWQEISRGAGRVLRDPPMLALAGGEICCFAGDDLVHALYQLHLRRLGLLAPRIDYDALVVDVGADIDTGALTAMVQNDIRLDATYRISRVMLSVDVGCGVTAADETLACRIGEADTIIITQSGGGDHTASMIAAGVVTSLNPLAAVMPLDAFDPRHTPPWRIAPGAFCAADASRLAGETGMVRLGGRSPGRPLLVGNLYSDARLNAPAAGGVNRALRMSIPGEADFAAAMHAAAELCEAHGRGLLRLSAVLNIRHADFPVAIDIIGGTLLRPAFHGPRRRADSDICILARNLDVKRALGLLERCGLENLEDAARLEAAF